MSTFRVPNFGHRSASSSSRWIRFCIVWGALSFTVVSQGAASPASASPASVTSRHSTASRETSHDVSAHDVSARVHSVLIHDVLVYDALVTNDIIGQVVDSATGTPLASVEMTIRREAEIVSTTTTDAFGRYVVHNMSAGNYIVSAQLIGYRPMNVRVTVTTTGNAHADFRLPAVKTTLSAVEIRPSVPLAVDTRTGVQRYHEDQYHGAPSTTTSQIIQQSVTGAARAPTGEVHIRGQHAEYTYYLDGVPVPAGISGSLNELFDPSVVSQINLVTGGWDAEFGNKNAAVIDVTTRIPTGKAHTNLSFYSGDYNANGESANVSGNSGRWGYFFSGTRQATNMRQEPVIFDTAANHAINVHNYGEDVFGFGKLQYTVNSNDMMTLEGNLSRTRFQVPYDTTGGAFLDDHQQDVNGFVNLGWRHQFGIAADAVGPAAAASSDFSSSDMALVSASSSELFAGLFYRYGTLRYTPGAQDQARFIFFPDTATPYNVHENRNFSTYGVKIDYTYRPTHGLELKVGTLSSITRGREDFTTLTQGGTNGPESNSSLSGHDIGVYGQTAYSPVEQLEIRVGARYDAHQAPFAGTQSQVSPRIKVSVFPNASNTVYAYYGRQFLPTNVEDLRAITSVAQGDTVTTPTLPERDNFYEVGYIHRFPFGVVSKLDGYYKTSNPGIDDNTVPGSAIVTSVNIARVWVKGVEGALEIRPAGPLSGYVNLALNHAYGIGPITGGFFPENTPTGYFDLDHDQRLSGVASATYAYHRFYVSGTEIYGSGLTNGGDPSDCDGCKYGTGLFDFNRAIKVKPSGITNLSAGYTFIVGQSVVRPEVFVDNAFNKAYLLKGAFFSGASVGRPRTVEVRLNVGM